MHLPKIYPITDIRISGLTHVDQVERLIAGGATFIQLREKFAPSGEFYDSAKSAMELARRYDVKIVINDRVDIALTLKADGVHLGQDDLPPEKAREILGVNAIIGFSTHTLEQVDAAIRLPIDYVAFGPVFATDTKANPDPTVGLELLKQASEIAGDKPLVAIGGITKARLNSVLAAGADSAAMIGELVSDPEKITVRVAKMLNTVKH